jgi:hypothetical protein
MYFNWCYQDHLFDWMIMMTIPVSGEGEARGRSGT